VSGLEPRNNVDDLIQMMLPNQFRALQHVSKAQVRLAGVLASELRTYAPWREAVRAAARGPRRGRWQRLVRGGACPSHALLADQLPRLQRCAFDTWFWADRARLELRLLAPLRKKAKPRIQRAKAMEDQRSLEAVRAEMNAIQAEIQAIGGQLSPEADRMVREATDAVWKGQQSLEATLAEVDGLLPRLHVRHWALMLEEYTLKNAVRRASLLFAWCDYLEEIRQALERAEQTLQRLHGMAAQAVDQVDHALGAYGASAGARELGKSLVAVMDGLDPDVVETLARDTERFISERADAAQRL
jgi:hypothetical protein